MQSMKVMCSRFNNLDKRIEVIREITNDDGSIEYNGLSLPTNRLEWISAEYEIDDVDELVDIAIYESLMEQDDKHPDADSARRQKRARLLTAKNKLGPMRPAANRQSIKDRLTAAGLPPHFINAVDDDSIDVIKLNSIIDQTAVNSKRELIRAKRRGEPVTENPSPAAHGNHKQRSGTPVTRTKLPTVELVGGKRKQRQ